MCPSIPPSRRGSRTSSPTHSSSSRTCVRGRPRARCSTRCASGSSSSRTTSSACAAAPTMSTSSSRWPRTSRASRPVVAARRPTGRTSSRSWRTSAPAGDALDAAVDAVGQAAARRIATAVRAFTLRAADERRVSGELAFHDLLVLARSLLRDPEHGAAVRTRLHERYTRLLLDEFQDTDPIQIELATRIAAADPGSAEAGTAEWFEVDARARPPLHGRRSEAVDLPVPSGRHQHVHGGPGPFRRGRRRVGAAHGQLPFVRPDHRAGSTPPSAS